MQEPMTIGAKRNALCDAAKSEIIAHFDDDDFYGHAEGTLNPEPGKDVHGDLDPWPGIRERPDLENSLGHFRRIRPVLAAGRLPLGPKSGPEGSRRRVEISQRSVIQTPKSSFESCAMKLTDCEWAAIRLPHRK